jgi:O-antigen/teichoic acid export membrane protein
MMSSVKNILSEFFNKGGERTVLLKKNIAFSFGLKGMSILITLISLPLTIAYLNQERNGIWLTVYTMIVWMSLFDIGLGTGMKNKVAEAKARGDNDLAKRYVSTTYAVIFLICISVFALFCFINPYLNWIKILNIEGLGYDSEIPGLIWIIMIMFCVNFILNPIMAVLAADQRPSISSFINFIWYVITFVGTIILYKTTEPSLIYIGLLSCCGMITVYVVASIYLFSTRYKKWRPSLRCVEFRLAGDALKLGVKFFIATIASFMVMQSLPFMIQKMVGPEEVTNFNSAMKLFTVTTNAMAIIIVPYWSSFTDAYTKRDYAWMQSSAKTLYRFFCALLAIQVVLLLLSPIIYYLWVNYWLDKPLNITFLLSVSVCVFSTIFCWTNLCIYPINGMGKARLQLYSSLAEIVLFIPIALFLGHLLGAPGIIFASALIYLPRAIWAPVQLNKLIKGKAKGIWDK